MSQLLRRRQFIQRMGLTTGSFLLNPILDSLISQAWGQVSNKKRLIIYMTGGHMPPEWTATGGSNPNYTLPYIFSPLEAFKKEMLVLRNLHCTVYPNLHGNLYGTLSGFPSIGVPAGDNFAYLNARPGGPSFDTVLSNELGGGTRHKEMAIGYTRPSQTGLAEAYDKVKPTVMNPRDVLNKFIAGSTGSVPVDQTGLKMKKSILDFAVGDIKKAYRGLASPEKDKFNQFLANVEDISGRINIAPSTSVACSNGYQLPTRGIGPAGENYPTAEFTGDMNNRPWWSGNGFCGNEYLHAEMAALAVGCGITRHVTFVSAYHEAHQYYPDIGVNVDIHESICHVLDKSAYRDATAIQRGKEILKFHASVVAKMYDKLKKTPEGNGTAADNTLILWFCDVGGVHHYGHWGYTGILLGNAGGAIRTGASYTYGDGEYFSKNSKYTMNQLYFTIAKAMGSTMSQVGDGTNVGNSVIPGILA